MIFVFSHHPVVGWSAYANETVWREENVQEETRVVPAARRHLDHLGVKDSLVTPQPQLCHD